MISQEYPSKTTPGKSYVAQVHENGLVSCQCPGWTSKREGKPRFCTHCKDLVARYGLTVEERDGQMFVVSVKSFAKPAPVVKPALSQWDSEQERVGQAAAFVNPMLASSMPDGHDAERYATDDFVMEEKYDGHRIVFAITLGHISAWSRGEKARTLPKHVNEQALLLPDGIYDGELIVPGKHSYDVTAGMNTGTERLMVFDVLRVLDSPVTSRTQDERRALLDTAFDALADVDPLLQAVFLAKQEKPSVKAIEKIWKRGGEGAIIKRRSGRYQPGFRSGDWIKVKKVAAASLTIVGFEPGKVGAYSAVKIRDAEGIETTVKTLDNQTMRAMQADPDRFIGRTLVISYQERTPSGKYRHPMWDHLLPSTELVKGKKR